MAAQTHHQSPPMSLHHAVGGQPPPGPPGAQWAPSRQILAMNEAVWVQIGMSKLHRTLLQRIIASRSSSSYLLFPAATINHSAIWLSWSLRPLQSFISASFYYAN